MMSEFLTASTGFVAVAAGGSLGMALRANGAVVAWGVFGGDVGSIAGPDGRAFVPEGLAGVKAIATSGDHCLAVKEDGTVSAWGVDERGRLSVPRGLTGVTAVAAGFRHNLALKSDGTVVAWGDNSGGGCDVPVGLTEVVSVSIVGLHGNSVAIRRDGTIAVWGGNGKELEGVGPLTSVLSMDESIVLRRDGTVVKSDGTPFRSIRSGPDEIEVPDGLSDIASIAGPLLLRADGTVVYRGDWQYRDEMAVPRDLAGVRAIAAGRSFALALKEDGTLVAWGSNSGGQLDVPSARDAAAPFVPIPRAYPTHATDSERPRSFIAVAAGHEHSVALRNDGTVVAWGGNSRGQLDVPENLTGVTGIAAGDKHSIALLSDGTVVTWGRTVGGPIDQPPGLNDVIAIAAGGYTNLALRSDGTLVMWPQSFSSVMELPSDWIDIIAVAFGGRKPIALRRDGRVLVQEGFFGIQPAPTHLADVASVAASNATAYALHRDGRVTSWGKDENDPLAALKYANGRAVQFPDLSNVVAIAAGGRHAIALKSGGTVVAWGDNDYGQTTVPAGLDNVAAIAAGEAHSLAVTNDGRITAWGLNRDGQSNPPSPESEGVDSNFSRIVLDLVFRAKKNITGNRFWKFRFGETGGVVGTWLNGHSSDLVVEDNPLFAFLLEGDTYYPMMTFRIMEQYFPSFKWESDVSQRVNDPEDLEFPIAVTGKISIRQQDLTAFLADQASYDQTHLS